MLKGTTFVNDYFFVVVIWHLWFQPVSRLYAGGLSVLTSNPEMSRTFRRGVGVEGRYYKLNIVKERWKRPRGNTRLLIRDGESAEDGKTS